MIMKSIHLDLIFALDSLTICLRTSLLSSLSLGMQEKLIKMMMHLVSKTFFTQILCQSKCNAQVIIKIVSELSYTVEPRYNANCGAHSKLAL